MQSLLKLRNLKWCLVSSLIIVEDQAISKGSDQTARMRRLIWGIAGRTYHIVGNLMRWLIYATYNLSYHTPTLPWPQLRYTLINICFFYYHTYPCSYSSWNGSVRLDLGGYKC